MGVFNDKSVLPFRPQKRRRSRSYLLAFDANCDQVDINVHLYPLLLSLTITITSLPCLRLSTLTVFFFFGKEL